MLSENFFSGTLYFWDAGGAYTPFSNRWDSPLYMFRLHPPKGHYPMNDLRRDKEIKNRDHGLKTHIESSHNQKEHEHMVALVKFLARRAAEEDFKQYLDALENHPDQIH